MFESEETRHQCVRCECLQMTDIPTDLHRFYSGLLHLAPSSSGLLQVSVPLGF